MMVRDRNFRRRSFGTVSTGTGTSAGFQNCRQPRRSKLIYTCSYFKSDYFRGERSFIFKCPVLDLPQCLYTLRFIQTQFLFHVVFSSYPNNLDYNGMYTCRFLRVGLLFFVIWLPHPSRGVVRVCVCVCIEPEG